MDKDISVIISGFGGQGALFAGILLCHAAVLEGKNTTWIPSYGAEMRGGSVNCTVNISDSEIPSPIIDKVDVVIALNDASQKKFENKVKKGGLMIVNTSLCRQPQNRNDIEYLNIPMNDYAQKLAQPAFINVIAMGAFLEYTKILQIESVKKYMEIRSKEVSAKKAATLVNNFESLDCGANIVREKMAVSK